MITKIGAGILLTVAMFFIATPSNVFAASSDANKKKTQKFFKQLKKLPNGASPANKVSSLVKKLSKLDPKKSNKYYKIGLQKLAKTQANKAAADKLAKDVIKTVKKSGLPSSQIKKLQTQITTEDNNFQPTPPPYQAWNTSAFVGALS